MHATCRLGPVVLGFLGIALHAAPTRAQDVIFVDAAATGAGDGSSWASAFTSVQPAINAAGAGDQVWVAEGRYVGTLVLKSGVALYGGLAGDEDPATFDLADRAIAEHETILDGNQAGSVVAIVSSASAATRLDGFTVTGGYASDGGGIRTFYGAPTITNNLICRNIATRDGGAICLFGSAAIIVDNVIVNNSVGLSGYGGGICGRLSGIGPLVIERNQISGNSAGYGGGVYLARVSGIQVTNNLVLGNSAAIGAGGLSLTPTSGVFANNTVAGNIAPQNAGGVLIWSDAALAIDNNIIAFNFGGIYDSGSGTPVLRNNCVFGNGPYDYAGMLDPTGTAGNISADPLFADLYYGNPHLQPGSPCIDAGSSGLAIGMADVDGDSRELGLAVDIGADESIGGSWPAGPYITVRVAPDGDDAADGSSWVEAKASIQAALDAAGALGGDVWVAGGTYEGSIHLPAFVHLYGGFGGSETSRTARDWKRNPTILQGEGSGSVVLIPAGHLVSTLDGMVVTGGVAELGGGVYVRYASPVIANNEVRENEATLGGGGLYLRGSAAFVVNNRIAANHAEDGGGVAESASEVTYVSNVIVGNSASNRGGGAFLHVSRSRLVNLTIAGNRSWSGGGVYQYNGGLGFTVRNTIVAYNSSGVLWDGLTLPFIDNTIFSMNDDYDFHQVGLPPAPMLRSDPNPRFVDTPDKGPDGMWATADDAIGNLRLASDSPAIDAGDGTVVPPDLADLDEDGDRAEPVPLDFEYAKRFLDDPLVANTGTGEPPVDIGAYEYRLVGDWTGDWQVDVSDYPYFGECLRGADAAVRRICLFADADADGDVDLADFGAFQVAFMKVP